MLIPPRATTINAMDLRRESGTLLDRADYRNESFVIERAGKPKAVLVPYSEFEQLQRIRQEARERYFASVGTMREAFSDLPEEEINALVEEAVQSVRAE